MKKLFALLTVISFVYSSVVTWSKHFDNTINNIDVYKQNILISTSDSIYYDKSLHSLNFPNNKAIFNTYKNILFFYSNTFYNYNIYENNYKKITFDETIKDITTFTTRYSNDIYILTFSKIIDQDLFNKKTYKVNIDLNPTFIYVNFDKIIVIYPNKIQIFDKHFNLLHTFYISDPVVQAVANEDYLITLSNTSSSSYLTFYSLDNLTLLNKKQFNSFILAFDQYDDNSLLAINDQNDILKINLLDFTIKTIDKIELNNCKHLKVLYDNEILISNDHTTQIVQFEENTTEDNTELVTTDDENSSSDLSNYPNLNINISQKTGIVPFETTLSINVTNNNTIKNYFIDIDGDRVTKKGLPPKKITLKFKNAGMHKITVGITDKDDITYKKEIFIKALSGENGDDIEVF